MNNLKYQAFFMTVLCAIGMAYGLISFITDVSDKTITVQGEHFFRSKCRTFGNGDLKELVTKTVARCPPGTSILPTQGFYFESCDDTESRVSFSFTCQEN